MNESRNKFEVEENSVESSKQVERFKDLQEKLIVPELIAALELYKAEGPIGSATNNQKRSDSDDFRIILFDRKKLSIEEMRDRYEYFDMEINEPYAQVLKVEQQHFYRPLLHSSFYTINRQILILSMLEVDPILRGKGIAPIFLNNLRKIMADWGVRFVVAFHANIAIERPFLEQGAFMAEEIRQECREKFGQAIDWNGDFEFQTVHFLRPEDRAEYIRAERLHVPVERKLKEKKINK